MSCWNELPVLRCPWDDGVVPCASVAVAVLRVLRVEAVAFEAVAVQSTQVIVTRSARSTADHLHRFRPERHDPPDFGERQVELPRERIEIERR